MQRLAIAARGMVLIAPLALLAACDQAAEEPETVAVPVRQSAAGGADGAVAAQDAGATPMAERVAVIGLLNKRNNVSEDIEMSPGESREIGPVTIRLSACERTAPWEMPQEVGAFVQVDIAERAGAAPARVFSGWLFRESPSLNVVEHPIYDVWIKDCTMAFPGEDAKPAAKPAPGAPPASAPAPTPTPTSTRPPAPTLDPR
jgi:hypothetical protein